MRHQAVLKATACQNRTAIEAGLDIALAQALMIDVIRVKRKRRLPRVNVESRLRSPSALDMDLALSLKRSPAFNVSNGIGANSEPPPWTADLGPLLPHELGRGRIASLVFPTETVMT